MPVAVAVQAPAQAPAAHQPPPAPPGLWQQSADRITFTTAHLSFPLTAAATRFVTTFEASHPGEGLDTGIQFESADRQVFATVYVYRPGLPHSGLSAFATDWVIHIQSPNLRPLGMHVVSAGGHEGIAIRADYGGFRDGLATSAAFLEGGGWIVKLRASGPEPRRAEVDAAMSALLDGLRFEGTIQARPAAPVIVDDCEVQISGRARLLPDDMGHLMLGGMVSVLDPGGDAGGGSAGDRSEPLAARIGPHWCRSQLAPSGRFVLRAAPGRTPGASGASVMLVPINDAGTIAELTESEPHRFVLMYHEIGRTDVLGTYDAPLTDAQIADILSGTDQDGGRFRALIAHHANGNNDVQLMMPTTGPSSSGSRQ
ncbi:MAG: hypothetical protein JO276_17585 [Sphingomonadaceae bacterium]|nr:hypothetical protein [Sphingomonadaceae bacterium]